MTSTNGPAGGAVHLIDHALTVADARAALASLTGAVDSASRDGPLVLDLTDSGATAPALQLLIAGARALAGAGAFAGFGPAASAVLGALCIDIASEGQGILQ